MRKRDMTRHARILQASALCMALAHAPGATAAEQPHDFQHDDGKPTGGLKPGGKFLAAGSIIATRFRPQHRFRLDKVALWFTGNTGVKAKLHIWRDNGGLQPGAPEGWYTNKAGADVIPPKTVYVQTVTDFQTIDLTELQVQLPAIEPFWVGIEIVQAGATIAVDQVEESKATVTALWQTKSGPCKDGCGVPADLLIRAQGAYLDPLTDAQRWFTDITEASGLKPGSRMAWADFDRDGDLDCLVAGRALYRNDGTGSFAKMASTGLEALAVDKGLWADFDNDGVLDLLVFGNEEAVMRGVGSSGCKHSGTFEVAYKFSEAPNGDRWPTEAAVWLDIDNDGLLDVYFANYEQKLSQCERDFLWRNKGDGTFEDVSDKFGVLQHGKHCGRGITAVDWDQDGDVDVFVGNYRLDPNFFFRTEWPATWMTNIADQNLTIGKKVNGAYGHAIGPSFVDADSDGDFDLFVANLAHPRFITFSDRSLFYQNLGKDKLWEFSEHRKDSAITFQETHSDARFGDFDNDGYPDLAITNVYKGRKGRVWRNLGPGGSWLTFEDVTYRSGIVIDNGWGSAWPDIDGDGDLDYVANRLLRNDYSVRAGKSGHWLKVRLIGADTVNRAAIGAWAVAHLADGRRVTRHVSGGDGLSGQSGLVMHFGLGSAKVVDHLELHWPGGTKDVVNNVAADQLVSYQFGAVHSAPGRAALCADGAGSTDASTASEGSDAAASDDAGRLPTAVDNSGHDGGCASVPGPPRDAPWALWLIGLSAALSLVIRRSPPARLRRRV